MGWSCRADAGRTMDALVKACREQTKMSSNYIEDGREYFWEPSNREHADGAITGSILLMLEKRPDGSGTCRKVGSFRIEPDGSVKRGPAILKLAAKTAMATAIVMISGSTPTATATAPKIGKKAPSVDLISTQ